MYRYRPPKSSIWGHRLSRLTTRQIQERIHGFLDAATGEHRFTSGILSVVQASPEDALAHELLTIAGDRQHQMNAEATDQCIATLAAWEEATGRRPEFIGVLQGWRISEWRIRGRAVPTDSQLHVHYGMLACVSTRLWFDSIASFECIRDVEFPAFSGAPSLRADGWPRIARG